MTSSLLRAVQIVIRTDSDPARQALFTAMLKDSLAARVVSRVHGMMGRRAAALLVSVYGVAAYLMTAPPRRRGAHIAVLARHANARRQVTIVGSWIGADECGTLRTGRAALISGSMLSALAGAIGAGRLAQIFRIVGRIDRRFGFLVACRVAGAIGWYARSRRILQAQRPAGVLVSSDAQPEELAFVAAARRVGIPTIFASHAYPTPLSPPLAFNLSILEGEAEAEARRRIGPVRGAIVLAGIPGESAAMDASRLSRSAPAIGIFTPKAVSWPVLRSIITECRQHCGARRIVIRWHPSMLERPHLDDLAGGPGELVVSPAEARLVDVARDCDWVIADENSHVHLPVLKLGIPTVAFRLGVYPESRADQYGLIASRIVFPRMQTLADLDVASASAFFSECWADRFARYDAAYLRPANAIADDVRSAVWRVCGGEEPMVAAR